jgi:hypothetical protein
VSREECTFTCVDLTCPNVPSYVCACPRCNRETALNEKFHSCTAHRVEVEDRHIRIRGDMPMWRPIKNTMSASELFSRARDCLANKSRSYVEDARLFARAVLLMEQGVLNGDIEVEVERE